MNLSSQTFMALISAALVSTAAAVTITPSLSGGSGDVDNVLFQAGGTGTTVDAQLNTSGGTFIARFTSSTDTLTVSGGQSSLHAIDNTLQQLTFSLLDGGFTKLILNPNAIGSTTITFNVTYINPLGVLNNQQFAVNAGGQNFFTILSDAGQIITSVSFNAASPFISDTNQFRVGGAVATTTSVPDSGATMSLLGLGLFLIAAAKRKFAA